MGIDRGTYSLELCGGTHVKRTGDIGFFKIISETASASGVRRIEAVTGNEALNLVLNQGKDLKAISGMLRVSSSDLVGRVGSLVENKKELEIELARLKKQLIVGSREDNTKSTQVLEKSNISFSGRILNDISTKDLRSILDQQKQQIGSGIVLLIGNSGKRLSIICGVTDDLTSKYSAIDIVRRAAHETGGSGGGGRLDMAQAGGTDCEKAKNAIEAVKRYIEGV